jgi:hypothetical protein
LEERYEESQQLDGPKSETSPKRKEIKGIINRKKSQIKERSKQYFRSPSYISFRERNTFFQNGGQKMPRLLHGNHILVIFLLAPPLLLLKQPVLVVLNKLVKTFGENV